MITGIKFQARRTRAVETIKKRYRVKAQNPQQPRLTEPYKTRQLKNKRPTHYNTRIVSRAKENYQSLRNQF